jgi:hypothetical protein
MNTLHNSLSTVCSIRSIDIENHIMQKHKSNQLSSSYCSEIRKKFNKSSDILPKHEFEKIRNLLDKFCPDIPGFRSSER